MLFEKQLTAGKKVDAAGCEYPGVKKT